MMKVAIGLFVSMLLLVIVMKSLGGKSQFDEHVDVVAKILEANKATEMAAASKYYWDKCGIEYPDALYYGIVEYTKSHPEVLSIQAKFAVDDSIGPLARNEARRIWGCQILAKFAGIFMRSPG